MAYMRNSKGQRLDSFAVPESVQTIVFLGDSLTEQGGMVAASPQIKPNSAWTWAMAMLGQRFKVLKNAGIGGQTTTQILARFDADVTALNPGWVHILCGTNDVGVDVALAKTNITAMLNKADLAGIRVILGTIPPRLPGSYTGTSKADTIELNRWIVATARTRPNVILVNYFAALADVAGQFRSLTAGRNPTSDGVHLSGTGGFACGLALANALEKVTTPATPYIPYQGAGSNMLPNPDMGIGTASAVPNSWNVAGTGAAGAVYSIVERENFPATPWKQVVIANGTTVTMSSNSYAVGTNGLAVGDSVIAYLDYDISSLDQAATAGQQGFFLRIKMWNGSTYTNTMASMEDYNIPITGMKGTFYINDYVIPAGTTLITMEITLLGGGTYKLGRAGLYKAGTFAP